MADGPEKHGVKLPEFIGGAVGKRFSRALVPFPAEIEFRILQLESAVRGSGVQDLDPLPNHFRPGPVSGERCDLVGLGHKIGASESSIKS